MEEVDIREVLKYGFRIIGYYLAVAIVGGLLSAVGSGLALFEMLKIIPSIASAMEAAGVTSAAQMGTTPPNVGLLLIGIIVLIVGLLLVLAGVFGSLYKLIADAVAEGRRLSELEPPADGDTDGDDEPAGEDEAAADEPDTETDSSDGDYDADDAGTDEPDDESDNTAD